MRAAEKHLVECTHCGDRHFSPVPQPQTLFCPVCAKLYRRANEARRLFALRKSSEAERRTWPKEGRGDG